MTPLRVGIVGCGAVGRRRATVAASCAGSRVVAVADRELERAKAVADATGASATAEWEEVVTRSDVEALVIATTHDALAPIALAALRAGKHVLVEKPIAFTSMAAAEVVEAARTSGRCLAVGFNHRFHPAIARARALATEGAIGPLLFARCRYGHGGRPGYEREWRMDPARSGGGELLDQGIHALDLFRWFLGDLVEASAMTATWVWPAPVEDNVFALLRSADGRIASLHASWTQWKNLFALEVFGERGGLVVEGLGRSYGPERLTIYRRAVEGAPAEERLEFPGPDPSWEREWAAFLATVRGEPATGASAEDGVAALRLVEAVYEASRTGRTVHLAGSR